MSRLVAGIDVVAALNQACGWTGPDLAGRDFIVAHVDARRLVDELLLLLGEGPVDEIDEMLDR